MRRVLGAIDYSEWESPRFLWKKCLEWVLNDAKKRNYRQIRLAKCKIRFSGRFFWRESCWFGMMGLLGGGTSVAVLTDILKGQAMMQVRVTVLAGLVFMVSGCVAVTGGHPKSNEGALESKLEVRMVEEEVRIEKDRGKLVYAEVVDSPRLTSELRQALANASIRLAQTREQGEVVYRLDGGFHAQRNSGRYGQVSMGAYAENPDELKTKKGTGTGEAGSLIIYGDPDGYLLFGSFSYMQSGTLVLQRVDSRGGTVTTTVEVELGKEKAMHPIVVFQTGLDALCKSIGLPERSISIANP